MLGFRDQPIFRTCYMTPVNDTCDGDIHAGGDIHASRKKVEESYIALN